MSRGPYTRTPQTKQAPTSRKPELGNPSFHPAPVPVAKVTSPRRPTIRMQSPDEEDSNPVTLPSPEELGINIVSANPAKPQIPKNIPDSLNWNQVISRMKNLGVVGFNMTQLSSGKHQIVITVPNGGTNRYQVIEVVGNSQTSAVLAALQQAEQHQRGLPQ